MLALLIVAGGIAVAILRRWRGLSVRTPGAHRGPRLIGRLARALLLSAAVYGAALTILVVVASLLTPRGSSCKVDDLPHARVIPPQCVFDELNPNSAAIVAVTRGSVTLNFPRNMLAGMFSGPIYCPSGRGVCGPQFFPQIALLYPSFVPIPADRAAEFRVMSAAWHPDLIYAVLLGKAEPAGAAASLGGTNGARQRTLTPGPYGLFRFIRDSDAILVGYPGTPDRVALDLPISGKLTAAEQINAEKYVLGDVDMHFQFNASLLPHWSEIDDRLTRLIEESARR